MRVGSTDITADMLAYFVAQHRSERLCFFTEKGVAFATQKDNGGWDLYSNQYAEQLLLQWANKSIVGVDHNFPAFAGAIDTPITRNRN